MKRILFIHSSADLYGSDRALVNIVKYIDKKKYKIFVLVPSDGPLVAELNQISNVDVEIGELAVLRRKNMSFSGMLRYIKEFKRSCSYLKKYLRNNQIDIVYTNTSVVICGAFMAKRLKIKNIWHIREIIKNDFENKFISRVVNRLADIIVVNSRTTGEALKVSKEKIRLVYDAVEDKKDEVIVKTPHDNFVVGMAGRINRWKGQKVFVDAAAIVHEHYPDVMFEIAGSVYKGEEYLKEDLQAYIVEKGLENIVLLLGHIDNMDNFYKNLDLFILPSIQPEPFGLVVIEAMEFCIPVIATNHGGPVEIIDNKKDGYLVEPFNSEELASTIEKLMLSPKEREKIGIKGRNKKRKMFSIKTMIKSTESVLDEVIKNYK